MSTTLWKPSPEELAEIVNLNGKWRRGESGGKRADLADADLADADLTDANLTDANLTRADLTDADLTDANLTDADLTRANLTRANLTEIKEDILAYISKYPAEVPGLIEFLNAGRVDGSMYSGRCACLAGSIAILRKCSVDEIEKDPNSPRERWFLAIRPGHTPENNPVAAITAAWLQEWLDKNPQPEQEPA